MAGTGSEDTAEVRGVVSKEVIRKYHTTPLFLYRLKDILVDIKSNAAFIDSILMVLGFVAFAAALPFYPLVIAVLIVAVIFAASLKHPFLGLIIMVAFTFPMVMYQLPALAWIYIMVISLSLIYGYMHHRTIAFLFILVALPFSALGYVLSIPVFMLAILVVGYKRASVIALIMVLGVVMLSGVTGIQNTAYIAYNPAAAHAAVSSSPIANYSVPDQKPLDLLDFWSGAATGYSTMASGTIVGYQSDMFASLFTPLFYKPVEYVLELVILIIAVFVSDMIAVNSRSRYHGTEAGLVCVLYPLAYLIASVSFSDKVLLLDPFASFAFGLLLLLVVETNGVDVVKALAVRKEDLRLKFGEAFEDLAAQDTKERFDDIGDYAATKKELKDAIIFPIEQKGISRAYNVKPVKGVLLFGPPGTGKTMLMRAVANEIHVGFYLIKASNLISPMPGETERHLAGIFAIARKNMPCVLFIDEIDSIARSRQKSGSDESRRGMLTQLLMEMDGFEATDRIIVVGATNTPQILDPAIMRPGRFDRIIYMPLPDFDGRRQIFKIYLGKLPVAGGIDIDSIAKATERYSGADIKTICESAAQEVAQEAVKEHKVLEITESDLMNTVKMRKPSASLAQLREYTNFKIDFERRVLGQSFEEKKEKTLMESVVGLDDAKKAIKDAVEIPLLHPEMFKKYGVRAIKGVLLFGPPGTGKTMLMSSLLNEMKDITILQISASELVNEDPKNAIAAVRKIFNRAAENTPSVVLIDEVDGIIPSRKDSSEGMIQLTNEILQQIDGITDEHGIVVIGATNRPYALDPAMLRPGRFDKIVFVRPPNEEERAKLFEKYMEGAPFDEKIDFKQLAKETNGFTGADISNVCREMKMESVRRAVESGNDVVIEMDDLLKKIGETKPSAPESALEEYMTFLSRYGER
jgi:SpoVK/Ycf46/Vps4 family AAA+-type ATPase